MDKQQHITEDYSKSITVFSISCMNDFERNLVVALEKTTEGKATDLSLLELYASAGAADWAFWSLKKSTSVFPELRLTYEQLEPQMDWLMIQLRALELGLDSLDVELQSEVKQAIKELGEDINTAIEEIESPGDFRFEKILILRDIIAYASQFLITRLEFRKDLFLELDIFNLQREMMRTDLKLKMNYSRLAEKYLYVELSSKAPENFWWRHEFNFMHGPGEGKREALILPKEISDLL